MGKAPAFQFYAADFLMGTREMFPHEIGVYIRMLATSWDRGPLPLEIARLALIAGVSEREFLKAWKAVGAKWVERDGGYVNERLERQRAELETFTAKQAANGRLGGRPKGSHSIPNKQPKENPPVNPNSKPEKALQSSVFDLQTSDPPSGKEHPQGVESAAPTDAVDHGGFCRPVNPHSQPTNLINGREQRVHGSHGWCSWPARPGLCVPTQDFHRELMGKALKSDADMRAFYAQTVGKYQDVPVTGDIFEFWRREVDEWVGPSLASRAPRGDKVAGARSAVEHALAIAGSKQKALADGKP